MCSKSNHLSPNDFFSLLAYGILRILNSILSNESPPMHARMLQINSPKELVCKYNKDEMLLYSVYTDQTMGSTHQRRGSPKEICNSLNACNGIPYPKHYTPIRKFETIFMSSLECTVLLS